MSKIDFYSLDGCSLRTLLTVLEELSVTRAAARLEVTQTAVSHSLDKLRLALGDPLFVRSGRGIAATERAIALREPVQMVLDELKVLTDQWVFDPSIGRLEFTIAANDFQRDLIFPELPADLTKINENIHLKFIPSGLPVASLLNQDRCQLLITPYPPEGPNIFQARLFEDHLACFYDSRKRKPPTTWAEFVASDYVQVCFEDNSTSPLALSVDDLNWFRERIKQFVEANFKE